MAEEVDVASDVSREDDAQHDLRFNRRKFLIGAAVTAGAAALAGKAADDLFLGGLQAADASAAVSA